MPWELSAFEKESRDMGKCLQEVMVFLFVLIRKGKYVDVKAVMMAQAM